MAFLPKVQPYAIVPLDLTVARNVAPLGSITTNLGVTLNTWIANQLLVNTLSTGANLSIGLQDGTVTAGMFTAATGVKFAGIPFNDILLTNTAQVGGTAAQLIVAWID